VNTQVSCSSGVERLCCAVRACVPLCRCATVLVPCCCVPLVCLLHRQVLSNACVACLLSKQMQGARKGVDVLSQNGSLYGPC